MSEKTRILLEPVSDRDDGKFIDYDSGEELTLDEVIEVIQDYWRDMPMDYCSWDLKKVVFKEGE